MHLHSGSAQRPAPSAPAPSAPAPTRRHVGTIPSPTTSSHSMHPSTLLLAMLQKENCKFSADCARWDGQLARVVRFLADNFQAAGGQDGAFCEDTWTRTLLLIAWLAGLGTAGHSDIMQGCNFLKLLRYVVSCSRCCSRCICKSRESGGAGAVLLPAALLCCPACCPASPCMLPCMLCCPALTWQHDGAPCRLHARCPRGASAHLWRSCRSRSRSCRYGVVVGCCRHTTS